jgi:lactoylglutathione lyase
MRYLHTMIRVTDLERAKRFYTEGLGFEVVREGRYEDGRFTLVFLRASGDRDSDNMLELTHNWDTTSYTRGDAYGHVAYEVASIAEVRERLERAGYELSWGPGRTPDGKRAMAFVDDPDGYEIELLERG